MAPVQSMLTIKMTKKELAKKHFILNPLQSTKDKEKYVCNLCHPDWTASQANSETIKTISKGIGYQWAFQHLEQKHAGQYESEASTTQTLIYSKEAETTFEWIQWVTSENQELDFVEKPLV